MNEQNFLYTNIYHYLLDNIKEGTYNNQNRLPTDKELCEMFGVSRITCKKAIDMLVSKNVVERIRGKGTFLIEEANRSMEEIDDKLCRKDKKLIGIVLPDFSEAFALGIISGIERECSLSGASFILKRSYGDLHTEERVIDELLSLGVCGLGIMPVHGEFYSPKIVKLILDSFPTVVMDRQFRGIKSCFVGTDNIDCAKLGTNYLLDLGHQNICFLSPKLLNTSTLEDRATGISQALLDRDISIDRKYWYNKVKSVLPVQNTAENIALDIEKIKNHLYKHPEITAIFASEYNVALLARQAVLESQKDIPQDISIMCFDSPPNFLGDIDFTHIEQNQLEIGKIVVQTVMELCTHNKKFFARDSEPDDLPNYYSTNYVKGCLKIGKSTMNR